MSFWRRRILFGWIAGFEPRGPPPPRLKALCEQLPYLTHQAELTLMSLPLHNIITDFRFL